MYPVFHGIRLLRLIKKIDCRETINFFVHLEYKYLILLWWFIIKAVLLLSNKNLRDEFKDTFSTNELFRVRSVGSIFNVNGALSW